MKYALIIISALAGSVGIIKDFDSSLDGRKKWINFILLTFILISAILSMTDQCTSDANEDKLKAKNDSLKLEVRRIQDTLVRTSESLRDDMYVIQDTLRGKITDLIQDNYLLSKSLTENSLKLNKSVLGEGFGVFALTGIGPKNHYVGGLRASTKFPIYDVDVRIMDYDSIKYCLLEEFGKMLLIDASCYKEKSIPLKVNSLRPERLEDIGYEFTTDNSDYKLYEIAFTSRNVYILQQTVIKLQRGTCPQSYKIFGVKNGKLVLIKTQNEINMPDSEWNKYFLPTKNRAMAIFE